MCVVHQTLRFAVNYPRCPFKCSYAQGHCLFVTPERPKTSYLQLHMSNKSRRQIITSSICRILLGQYSKSRTSRSHQALNVVFYSENMATPWGKPKSQSPLCETNMAIKAKTGYNHIILPTVCSQTEVLCEGLKVPSGFHSGICSP